MPSHVTDTRFSIAPGATMMVHSRASCIRAFPPETGVSSAGNGSGRGLNERNVDIESFLQYALHFADRQFTDITVRAMLGIEELSSTGHPADVMEAYVLLLLPPSEVQQRVQMLSFRADTEAGFSAALAEVLAQSEKHKAVAAILVDEVWGLVDPDVDPRNVDRNSGHEKCMSFVCTVLFAPGATSHGMPRNLVRLVERESGDDSAARALLASYAMMQTLPPNAPRSVREADTSQFRELSDDVWESSIVDGEIHPLTIGLAQRFGCAIPEAVLRESTARGSGPGNQCPASYEPPRCLHITDFMSKLADPCLLSDDSDCASESSDSSGFFTFKFPGKGGKGGGKRSGGKGKGKGKHAGRGKQASRGKEPKKKKTVFDILNAVVPPNQKPNKTNTAWKVEQLLRDDPAQTFATDEDGWTVLHYAAHQSDVKLAKNVLRGLLRHAGEECVERKNSWYGKRGFQWQPPRAEALCGQNLSEMVELINKRETSRGHTALHLCALGLATRNGYASAHATVSCFERFTAIADLLLTHGACAIRTHDGYSPQDYLLISAEAPGNPEAEDAGGGGSGRRGDVGSGDRCGESDKDVARKQLQRKLVDAVDVAKRRCCDGKCRNDECPMRGAEFAKELMRCSRCQLKWFASKECQQAGWAEHKAVCVKPGTLPPAAPIGMNPRTGAIRFF